ncbi:hypothetical protein N665_1598s0004 [Sinapis alba]|nr:hypothetical protein N665_1598s0004 [Sinapis alba]
MGDTPSETVDQPPLRNDNHQRENGVDQGRHMIPLADLRFFLPSTSRRIITFLNNADIVRELTSFSWRCRQAIYILSGTGYVSEATLSLLPSNEQRICFGRGKILYLNGSFQPTTNQNGPNVIGILHVCLSGVPGGVAIASSLFACGSVKLEVVYVCGPWSVVQPVHPNN